MTESNHITDDAISTDDRHNGSQYSIPTRRQKEEWAKYVPSGTTGSSNARKCSLMTNRSTFILFHSLKAAVDP